MAGKFNVLVNRKKRWAVNTGARVRKFLESKGFIYSPTRPDYTIVVGGDGTLYHHLDSVMGKVLVIGSERSYRAQLNSKNWSSKLPKCLKNRSVRLPLLEVRHGSRVLGYAVNDVVFHSNDHKVTEIECVAGRSKITCKGDGLIIATPFGSTAYSKSAGGKVLALGSNKMCITPICPCSKKPEPKTHQMGSIKVSGGKNTSLLIDGKLVLNRASGTYTIRPSGRLVHFIRV